MKVWHEEMANVGLVREIKKKETMKYAAQNAAKKHKRKMKCMRKDLTASLKSQSFVPAKSLNKPAK